MAASDHGAGIARSGRDNKCPHCGANNRADAQWCWQCLERFPEPVAEAPAEPEDTTEEVVEPEVDEATLRTEAMSELAGIAGDEEVAERLSTLLSETPPVTPPTNVNGANGSGARPSATAVKEETEVDEGPAIEATIEGEKGSIEIKGKAITWTCSRCETVNSFETNICDVCGASFAEVLREPEEAKPHRDPNTVALVSLFFPGAGHAYIGLWGQAIARAIISVWTAVTAVFAAAQGAPQSIVMAVIFGLVSFGLWAVSAHDAFREASGQHAAVLLRERLFLYLVMGLLLLSVIMVFSLAIGARPS
jgi:hypothetical protein